MTTKVKTRKDKINIGNKSTELKENMVHSCDTSDCATPADVARRRRTKNLPMSKLKTERLFQNVNVISKGRFPNTLRQGKPWERKKHACVRQTCISSNLLLSSCCKPASKKILNEHIMQNYVVFYCTSFLCFIIQISRYFNIWIFFIDFQKNTHSCHHCEFDFIDFSLFDAVLGLNINQKYKTKCWLPDFNILGVTKPNVFI